MREFNPVAVFLLSVFVSQEWVMIEDHAQEVSRDGRASLECGPVFLACQCQSGLLAGNVASGSCTVTLSETSSPLHRGYGEVRSRIFCHRRTYARRQILRDG